MKMPVAAIACSLMSVMLSSAPHASDVDERIEAAKRFYASGELQSSVDALDAAKAAIRDELSASALDLFPEPLANWSADPPRLQSDSPTTFLTGKTLSRRYVRDDGAEITLSLLANSPLAPILAKGLSVPDMPQAQQGRKAYTLKGLRGVIEQVTDDGAFEITLMVDNRLVIHGQGTGLSDHKPLERYLQALDVDAALKAFN